jgi:hypothetical protein
LGQCWVWASTIGHQGYGTFFMPGHKRNAPKAKAHRVAWELTNGDIPEGLDVLHHCDVRHCVNPSHLYLGTDLENARDRERRNRRNPAKGEHNGRARLTQADVDVIRFCHGLGETQRSLGFRFGVSQGQISRIVRGVQWPHL